MYRLPRESFFLTFFQVRADRDYDPFRADWTEKAEEVNPKLLNKQKVLTDFFRSTSTFRVIFQNRSASVHALKKAFLSAPQPPIGKLERRDTAPAVGLDSRSTPPASPTPAVVPPRPVRGHFYGPDVSRPCARADNPDDTGVTPAPWSRPSFCRLAWSLDQ